MTKLNALIKLLRPHQYVKNLFIFLPLFFIGKLSNTTLLYDIFISVIAFSFASSSIYILNDSLDIEADKKHPDKRNRPLAAGLISKKVAFLVMGLLFLISTTLMGMLSLKALYIMLIYVVLNIGYCFFLKHIPIIDITIIAIGFILRIYVGSYVANVPLSSWIVMMTFLIALFLAIAKRRDDVLHFMKTGTKMRKVVNGYNLNFIDSSMSVMSAVIIVTYLLYTSSSEVIERLDNEYLFATSIFVILGILRYMQITFVEENSGSPTKILLKDKFIISTVFGWLLSFALIIYI